MRLSSYSDYTVGDRVYCLAWIGQVFDVIAKNEERRTIAIETSSGAGTFGQIDIFPETLFMLTHEHWDSIWYWPDRAGERYQEVFDRFLKRNVAGRVIPGYLVPSGLLALSEPDGEPSRQSMMFRIRTLDTERGQVRVHPVAAVGKDGGLVSSPTEEIDDAAWKQCGPVVPLRIEMRLYRWCLTFGEIVLNWEDLSAPLVSTS